MTRVADSIVDLIGNTPLLELKNYERSLNLPGKIIAKLEYFNPGGSVKDRIAYAMVKDAEEKEILQKNSVIIEPTSGNTGIGLALVAAAKGYRLIIVMPDTMSLERRKLLKSLGVELVLTPGTEGMPGAIRKSTELAQTIPHSFIPQQFENPANPAMHARTTAEEIWQDTGGQVDIFIAGVGTGGTVSVVGQGLKAKKPGIQIVAVEPADSPVLSGGKPGPHKLQGIGAGFVPKVFNREVIDEIFTVTTQEAYGAARKLAQLEGVLAGITSGAALHAGTILSQRPENKGKSIVVLLPDTGERYLSTDLFQ